MHEADAEEQQQHWILVSDEVGDDVHCVLLPQAGGQFLQPGQLLAAGEAADAGQSAVVEVEHVEGLQVPELVHADSESSHGTVGGVHDLEQDVAGGEDLHGQLPVDVASFDVNGNVVYF